jgi:hypothetical protein
MLDTKAKRLKHASKSKSVAEAYSGDVFISVVWVSLRETFITMLREGREE